jgi:ABC-2 type transport system ATP-binding protein/lipopolysaccharide transport system ATP-binding protein
VSDSAIVVEDVSKKYRWHRDKRHTIKERLARGRPAMLDEFWALKDVSLEVPAGTTFGLIGHNGSGKSTLLKLMAGIIRPSTGRVAVAGRLSALLELGAGFHPELTGRENVYLNGAILGLTRRQIDASLDQIIDFAGIGEFIDVPVKVYSSGMYVRLGFSIAVTVDPEVLLVDEIVAVGDEEFQRRCFDHLHELHRRGTTIVIVSHALGIVENLCQQAAWLDHGEVRALGAARPVVREYLDRVNEEEALAAAGGAPGDDGEGHTRLGSGEVRVVDLELLGADGRATSALVAGEPATIRMHYRAEEPIESAVFGLGFVHESGVSVAGPNSGATVPDVSLEAGDGHVDFAIPDLLFQPGAFEITTAIVHQGHVYDYLERAFDLRVRGSGMAEPGLVRLPGDWTVPAAKPRRRPRSPRADR